MKSKHKTILCFINSFIWLCMISAICLSKRMDIPPESLVEAGTITYFRLIITSIYSLHKGYLFFTIAFTTVVLFLFCKKIETGKSLHPFFMICALMFSLFKLIGITYDMCFSGSLLFNFTKPLVISNICIIIGYFCLYEMIMEILFYYLDIYKSIENIDAVSINWKALLLMLVCWLPCIVIFFPGTVETDALYQLSQFWGKATWTDHQPVFSTLLMGIVSWVGKLIFNMNFGVFIYILLQDILSAFVFLDIIKEYTKAGLGKFSRMFVWCFFSILPLWISFMQLFDKDVLFTIAVAEFSLWLYRNISREKQWSLCCKKSAIFFALCMCVILLRKNGIYTILFSIIGMLIFLKEKRKTIATLFGLLIITYVGIQVVVFSVIGIQKGSIREALSIPFQQTARVNQEYGDEVAYEEKEIINQVLDYDKIVTIYQPYLSDNVKNTYKEPDKHVLLEYFKVWHKEFWEYPTVYLDATLCNSYAYVYPNSNWLWGYNYFDMPKNDFNIHYVNDEKVRKQVYDWNMEFAAFPVIHYLYTPGTYVWIILFFCFYNFIMKKGRKNIIAIPALTVLLACIASPCLNSVRYALPILASTPIIILASLKNEI